MKIGLEALQRHIDITIPVEELVPLMEDVGLEVKRVDRSDKGTILTLELLANRGDHYSYAGIAQEIHGRTAWTLHGLAREALPVEDGAPLVEIKTDNCNSYALAEFVIGGKRSTLPDYVAQTIQSSGSNMVDPAVDITNYVGFAMGQPMHAFDADLVSGKITVRETVEGETALLLFEDNPRTLPVGIMVISDERNILAVAGVMGAQAAMPTSETKRIYVESAAFDPVSVRKASKALGIQSHSSMRFERGSDPGQVLNALEVANHLYSSIGYKAQRPVQVAASWEYPRPEVKLSVPGFNTYYGVNYSADELRERLARYGFMVNVRDSKAESLIVSVPSHRIWDIKEEKDLYEELGRSIGYNEFPYTLPEGTRAAKLPEWRQRKSQVEEHLVSLGFYEVYTDGFYGERTLSMLNLGEDSPLKNHVKTMNAEERDYSYMKNNNLAQALRIVATNINLRQPDVKAFEWTRTFHPNSESENGLCDEKLVFWMVASGNEKEKNWGRNDTPVDVFYMKGIVEQISEMLDLRLELRQLPDYERDSPVGTCLHPGRRAGIFMNGQLVGVVGEVDPRVLKASGIKHSRPCFVELSQDVLHMDGQPRKYVPPTNILPIIRDICLIIPTNVAVQDVVDVIKDKSPLVKAIKVTDSFNSEATGHQSAITFSIEFASRTDSGGKMTADQVSAEAEKIAQEVIGVFQERQQATIRLRQSIPQ